MLREGEKISFSEGGGGGINIVFGPKYRPLKREEVNWKRKNWKEKRQVGRMKIR